MRKKPEKPPHVSQKDWDDAEIPEWTAQDFARAKPFSEVFPQLGQPVLAWGFHRWS